MTGSSSSSSIPSKIKVGRLWGYPIIVTTGKTKHEAILLECNTDNPRDFLNKQIDVMIRWKVAGYNESVPASSVELQNIDTQYYLPRKAAPSVDQGPAKKRKEANDAIDDTANTKPFAVTSSNVKEEEVETDTDEDEEKKSSAALSSGANVKEEEIETDAEEEEEEVETDTDTDKEDDEDSDEEEVYDGEDTDDTGDEQESNEEDRDDMPQIPTLTEEEKSVVIIQYKKNHPKEDAQQILKEYCKFIYIKIKNGGDCTPSPMVDDMWVS